MAYTIKGTYVASCNCVGLCPCPVDGTPATENGECKGAAAFAITEGNLDDTDLAGVSFALYNFFPANITSGNWKVGIVVDDGASTEQAAAIERIVSGEEGGPRVQTADRRLRGHGACDRGRFRRLGQDRRPQRMDLRALHRA